MVLTIISAALTLLGITGLIATIILFWIEGE